MIQTNSMLKVIDNSGAKSAICIKVNKGFKKRYAFCGELITVSVKTLRTKRRSTVNVKKGEICKALLVRTKIKKYSTSGESFNFLENSVILLNRQQKFLFTRIFGILPLFIRYTKFMRILSMSSGIVY